MIWGMDKKVWLVTVFAGLFLLVLFRYEAEAVMYVCVDAKGKKQYTNMNSSPTCHPLKSRIGITRKAGLQRLSATASSSRGLVQNNSSLYDDHIRNSSRLYNVDPYLIKAIIKTESDFDRYALSKAGAQGLMQLMPGTAKELKVRNSFDPRENIDGGTRYLRNMLKLFDGNVTLSLAAYNAGPTLVKRVQRIPRIPETVRYVKKVLAHYKEYRGHLPQSKIQIAALDEQ